MTSKLDQLRTMSTVVADTGDIEAVRQFKPQDCTTNPSIVLGALSSPAFAGILAGAVEKGRAAGHDAAGIAGDLTVAVGAELAKIVPGRVSTEVDARLSFDIDASLARARDIVDAYERLGIGRERVLIKLASTWEGIRAARTLQRDGIDCNLTLLFSMTQAKACADAGVFLISPFVGRITDWYKARTGETYAPEADPGVQSVRRIYAYYKEHGIDTVVMGASFRSAGQIEALAGCDRLTIAPALLDALSKDTGTLARALSPTAAKGRPEGISEPEFRWEMNEDEMASDKLAEGIRKFHADAVKLEKMLADRLPAVPA
ncbi:transaldolase [Amaricoccus sp.]|uniref:transaldolase n=1 Tax=Amaricoccus sp. TaxID=1872485 RepID=UPI001B751549|nr:transaldolase [Amaricoccus sp.]MBP7241317.1 transaldolase [Amaricoccus sp.]